MTSGDGKVLLGWREWVGLPELGIPRIKAKVDTGARTSAIHAWRTERYIEGGAPWVRLHIHPLQRDTKVSIIANVAIIDERAVSDSGGHRERRIVVAANLDIGPVAWPIELTVTNRDAMLFRMLLGRTAMRGRIVVDPSRSYLLGAGVPPNRVAKEN